MGSLLVNNQPQKVGRRERPIGACACGFGFLGQLRGSALPLGSAENVGMKVWLPAQCCPCSGTFTSHWGGVGTGWGFLIRQGVHTMRCVAGHGPSQLSPFWFPGFFGFLVIPEPEFFSSLSQHLTEG